MAGPFLRKGHKDMSEDKKQKKRVYRHTIIKGVQPLPAKHTHVQGVEKRSSGKEVWHIVVGGDLINLTTSSSSTAVMDDAVRIYSPALERLAKR